MLNDNKLEITHIPFDSEMYKAELELRNQVLRVPLGLSLYDENLSPEKNQMHIGAFYGLELVGVLVLVPHENGEIKMRQVAVADKYQGKQIGTELVHFAENFAVSKGFRLMVLHARETAIPFYLKLGYKVLGDVFTEVTIPHYKMEKVVG